MACWRLPNLPAADRRWRSNVWLLVLGMLLLATTLGPGRDGFVSAVRSIYLEHVSQALPEFRERLLRETRALWGVLALGGFLCLAGYAWAGWRRRNVFQALLGPAAVPAWRGGALLLVLLASAVFIGVRISRDLFRAQALSGLAFEERRVRLGSESPLEPDYAALSEFRRGWRSGDGNLLVLRERRARRGFDPYFASAYLFPIRVHLASDSRLAQEPGRLRERGIGWVLRDDGSGAFRPERVEPAAAP